MNRMNEEQELPQGWVTVKLDEVMMPVRGIAFPKEVKAHAPAEGHIACLRTTNVQKNVEWGDLWFIPRQYAKRDDQIIQPLDILISTANSYELVGKVAQVHAMPHQATLGAFISLLRVKTPFDAQFFYYYLSASATQEAIRGFASTTTNISNVSTGKLATLDVVVPPLPEQRRIVAKLEELFSKLDAGVAAVRRTQALLKRYRQSVLHAAVTGELTRAWREQQASIGRDESQLTWKETTIGDVTHNLDNKRKPVSKKIRAEGDGTYPYYGANGQTGWINDFIFDEDLVLVVEDETFVGRIKPFCYKISGKTWVNNHAHVLKAKDTLTTDYLNYSLSYYPFTPLTTGSTGRKKLTKAALTSAPYQLPSLDEQHKIVAEVERCISVIDALELTLNDELKRAERLRQSILHQAFTGRLVPQDATDEPATVLLARLRATPASPAKAKAGRGRKVKESSQTNLSF